MSRLFSNADYYLTSSTPVSAPPLSMACWIYHTANAADAAIGLGDSADASNHLRLLTRTSGQGNQIRFQYVGTTFLETSTTHSLNTWHHLLGVSAAVDDHAVYLDGGGKDTDATSVSVSFNRISIGSDADSSPSNDFSGRVAEVAIWNAALSDAEAAALAAGFSPLFIKPGNLVFYAPLVRDLVERIGGLTLTPTSGTPSVAVHPPKIIYPAPKFYIMAPAAVGGVTVEGAAVMAGAGSSAKAGFLEIPSALNAAGSGLLAALAILEIPSSGILAGAGSSVLSSLLEIPGGGILAGSGSSSLIGILNIPAVLEAAGNGSLTAAGFITILSAMVADGQGDLVAGAIDLIDATTDMMGVGDLIAAPSGVVATALASVIMSGEGDAAISALPLILGNMVAAGEGDMVAAGLSVNLGKLVADGQGDLVAAALMTALAGMIADGQGDMVLAALVGDELAAASIISTINLEAEFNLSVLMDAMFDQSIPLEAEFNMAIDFEGSVT